MAGEQDDDDSEWDQLPERWAELLHDLAQEVDQEQGISSALSPEAVIRTATDQLHRINNAARYVRPWGLPAGSPSQVPRRISV